MVRRGKITSITEQGLQLFSEQYDFIKKQLEKQIKDCDYIIRFLPIEEKAQLKLLLRELQKEKFLKKQGSIYLWIDSYKYCAKTCKFIAHNMFKTKTHIVYPYFIPLFKKRDGLDFSREQLAKYYDDYENSRPNYRADKLVTILKKYK